MAIGDRGYIPIPPHTSKSDVPAKSRQRDQTRYHVRLGTTIIFSYGMWKELKRYWESGYLEGTSDKLDHNPWEGENTKSIYGGDQIKTKNPEYKRICRMVKKAERIFDSLSERARGVMVQYYWEGVSMVLVAERFGFNNHGTFGAFVRDLKNLIGQRWESDKDKVSIGLK